MRGEKGKGGEGRGKRGEERGKRWSMSTCNILSLTISKGGTTTAILLSLSSPSPLLSNSSKSLLVGYKTSLSSLLSSSSSREKG